MQSVTFHSQLSRKWSLFEYLLIDRLNIFIWDQGEEDAMLTLQTAIACAS